MKKHEKTASTGAQNFPKLRFWFNQDFSVKQKEPKSSIHRLFDALDKVMNTMWLQCIYPTFWFSFNLPHNSKTICAAQFESLLIIGRSWKFYLSSDFDDILTGGGWMNSVLTDVNNFLFLEMKLSQAISDSFDIRFREFFKCWC